MKRKVATVAELEACKRQFWEESGLFALQRAKKRVRAGEPIDTRDRDYVADLLEDLFRREHRRIVAMRENQPLKFRAYIADYLATELSITLEQASAAFDKAYKPDSVRKAVDRIRKERRSLAKRGRARR